MFSVIEDTDIAIYADDSSIISEVIRPVLNFFFFYDKVSQVQKGTKKHYKSTKKHQKSLKAI